MKSLIVLIVALATIMQAQNGPTPPSVALSWNQSSSPTVTGNCVYRGLTAGVYAMPALICFNTPTTTWTDTTILRGISYHYAVTAKAGNVESIYSNDLLVLDGNIAAPTLLSATNISKNTVQTTWQLAALTGVRAQFIARQNKCLGKFINQKQVTPTVTSWIDTGAKKGQECYQVTAILKNGVPGPQSNIATVTVQ